MTTTDYPDWLTAQHHADAIAATGAPLLAKSASLIDTGTQTIAAGGQFATAVTTFTQIGYDLFFQVQNHTSAVAVSQAQVQVVWFDPATGFALRRERWFAQAGPNGTLHQLAGSGPTKGSQVQITLSNGGASGDSIDIRLQFVPNSRVIARDDVRTTVWPATMPGTPTAAPGDIGGLLLAACQATNLLTGMSLSFVLPMFSGRVIVRLHTGSGTTDAECAIQTTSDTVGGNQTIFDQFSDAKGAGVFEIALSRANCVLTLTNHNAGTQSLNATIAIAEY